MPTSSDSNHHLRCDRCGCVLEITPSELLAFSQGDWPRCCMSAMTLEVDDQSVRPTDATDLERPARRVRKLSPD